MNHLEILKRISKGLPELALSFGLWSTNKTWKTIKNPIREILFPIYPLCKTIDLHDYYDLKNFKLQQFYIFLKVTRGVSVSFYVEERNMKVGRSLKASQKSYSGPLIEIEDLNSPRKIKSLISLSQIIHHERDKSSACVNYPYKNFKTFGECDRSFIYKEMLNRYGLIPFWTTKTLESVTKLRFNYFCSKCIYKKRLFLDFLILLFKALLQTYLMELKLLTALDLAYLLRSTGQKDSKTF